MARDLAGMVRSLVRRAPPGGEGDPPSDAELLARFTATRDQAAFELLVWRHGSMVLGVCRRVLRDHHLAEDAFQATFLVLARKAGSVRTASAAGYLHRVARRVAVRAARQRRSTEPLASEPPDRNAVRHDSELRALLDAEIDRLPGRFRLPIVLCYLDGRSTEDAARELGVPRGTVLSRLATARARLQARLARHGVTAPAVLAATGAMTADRVTACVAVAVQFVGGTTSGTAAHLAEGVLHMSLRKTIAVWGTALVMTAGLATGVGVMASGQGPPADRPLTEPEPVTVAGNDEAQKPDRKPEQPDRERQLAEQHRRLREMHAQTRMLIQTKQEELSRLQQGVADPIVLKARGDVLSRIEAEIFQTQLEIRKLEMTIAIHKQRIAENEKTPISEEYLADVMKQHARVRAVQRALDRLTVELNSLKERQKAGADPETPQLRELKATIADHTKLLEETQSRVKPEVVRQLRESQTRASREAIASAELELQIKLALLEVLKKDQAKYLQDLREMRSSSLRLEEIQTEIAMEQAKADHIKQQANRIEMQLQGIEPKEPQSANDKLDRILRELAELRAEVKELKERK